jgi:hypothetical protein
MASIPPKTTFSGGISPRGWMSELTGFEVLIKGLARPPQWAEVGCAPGEPNGDGADRYLTKVVYLIEEKQLTKDWKGQSAVISGAGGYRQEGR